MNGKTIAQYAKCAHKRYRFLGLDEGIAPGTGNGWVEASWGSSTQFTFTHMDTGSWTVPSNPTLNQNQLLYFFSSLTQGSGPSIIQPVLQWGNNGGFGGASWVYANWWVDGSTTRFVSSPKNTAAGNNMIGTLNFASQNGNLQTWTIVARDTVGGTSTTSSFTVDNGFAFNQVQAGVLEAYRVSSCSAFPSGSTGWTYFTAPVLYQGTYFSDRNLINPSWSLLGTASFGWTGPQLRLRGNGRQPRRDDAGLLISWCPPASTGGRSWRTLSSGFGESCAPRIHLST